MVNTNTSISERLEKTCHCLFCNAEFQAKDIQFFVSAPKEGDFYDSKYEKHISQYKGIEDTDAPYRVEVDWSSDPQNNVINWDENGLPETVKGALKLPDGYSSQGGNSSLGFGGFFGFGNQEQIIQPDEENGQIISESSTRVCPECHMTLIKGFDSDPVIRVGLLGGTRSGKTTYMVVASKYLEKRFAGNGDLDVHLGGVRFVTESKKFIDRLYEDGIKPTVKDEISLQMKDPPVLPVMMRITPNNEAYKPFILILQDIPGEYMDPDAETEELLACSGINNSTDLIMFVDSNHFVETRQRNHELNADDQFGEYCEKELNDLFSNYEVLGGRLNVKALKSIQIAITKLDFLIEADKRLEAAIFSHSGDMQHKNAISEKRLDLVNRQIKALLGAKEYGGYGCGNLVERIANPLKASLDTTRLTYTAVASKYVPGNDEHFDHSGIDVHYEYSLNVLEPLLNVFISHNLLPSVQEEYVKTNN